MKQQPHYTSGEARQRWGNLMRDATANKHPVITHYGHGIVVLLSQEEYEELQRAGCFGQPTDQKGGDDGR